MLALITHKETESYEHLMDLSFKTRLHGKY